MAEDFDFSKIQASSEKLAKTHESTIKHLIKSARNEEQKSALVKNHIRLLKEELKINKDLKPKEIKAIEAEIKATKNSTKATQDFGTKIKDAGAGLIKSIGKMALDTALAVPRTIMNFMDATSGVNDFTSATKEFAGTALHPMHMLGKSIDFNANMFKTLSQQGAGFGKSVINMRNAAHDANMTLSQFTDLVQGNTTTFAALFGNVDTAMASLGAFTRELRNRTQNELAEFGLNLEETSEMLMTQMELDRVRGATDEASRRNLIDRTVEYAKQLTKLSKLTGISVKELDEQNKAAAVEGTFQATLAGMDKDQRDRTVAMSTALSQINPALGQMFKELVAFGVPISEASRQMTILSKGAVPDLMNSFNRGGINSEALIGGLREAFDLNSPLAKALAQAGMLGMDGVNEALNAAAAITGTASNNLQEIMNMKDVDAGTIVGAREDLDKLLTEFQEQSTNILEVALREFKIKELLTTFGDYIDKLDNLDVNVAQQSLDVLKEIRDILMAPVNKVKGGFKKVTDFIFGEATNPNQQTGRSNILAFEKFLFPRGKDGGLFGLGSSNVGPGMGGVGEYQQGTYGFQDFGSGTLAKLHNSEMVIPEANADKIVSDLLSKAKTMEGTVATTNPVDSGELKEMVALHQRTLEATQNMSRSLNTLITVSAMTEKNTKNMNNNVANMGGSLV
jgi:hypothetical protein